MTTPNPSIPKTTTTHTDASPAAGAAEAAQPGAARKKGKAGRKKTKAVDGEERAVSLSIPEDLLKRIRVLSAISGESISSMVVSALTSKVRKELRQAMADLDT